MEIKPGIGLGGITFQVKKEKIESLLGKPESVEEDDVIMELVYYYFNNLLRLSFNKDNDYKLDTISIGKDIDNLQIYYKKYDLFSMDYDDILKLLQTDGEISNHNKEYIGAISGYEERFEFDSLGINITFNDKKLFIIQLHEIYGY